MSTTSSFNTIDALAYGSWSTTPGTAAALTYRFLTRSPNGASADDAKGFAPMSAAQQDAVKAALAIWSTVANVTFTEVTAGGQLRFGTNDQSSNNSSGYAYLPQPGIGSVEMYLNNKGSYNSVFTQGSFGPSVLLHEIGHMLGLKHPGNYDSAGSDIDGPFLPAETDNTDYSLMSYNNPSSFRGKYSITPRLYDIQAIQYLYGANMSYHTGNDVYAFANGQAPLCIWDAGGYDTFDFSACTAQTRIDLREGTFSGTATGQTNVSIAYNVTIEAVITGAGGSDVTLNDAGNTMLGGGGADLVRVGSGNDTIDTGDGMDTVVFGGLFGQYTFTSSGGGLLVVGQGRDLLKNVEILQFADRTMNAADLVFPMALSGTSGNDRLVALPGNELIDGGAGLDTLVYSGQRGAYTVRAEGAGFTVTDAAGSVDALNNVERLAFDDGAIALDTSGAAGEIYRLFLAAFNRAPAQSGLGFWIGALDNGVTLMTVAQNFLDSPEFQTRYGTPDDSQFVTLLFNNVLHRAPRPEGLAWHVANMAAGHSRAEELVIFAESVENQANVAHLIANGVAYTPYPG